MHRSPDPASDAPRGAVRLHTHRGSVALSPFRRDKLLADMRARVPGLADPRKPKLLPIQGQPPDLSRLPPGCAFQPRCQYAVERCLREAPPLESVAAAHVSACWVASDLGQKVSA